MEFVYVVKRYDLFNLEFPHGFCSNEDDAPISEYLERIKERGFFLERRFCELDSGFKQVIPYSIISHGTRILVLRRTSEQGEARLHNKQSIGVGGHINPVDGLDAPLNKGCLREIDEELHIEEPFDPIPIGCINDESNAVGSVHFGIVHLVKLKSDKVSVKETSMMTAEFVDVRDLKEAVTRSDTNFETWSSLIIEHPKLESFLI